MLGVELLDSSFSLINAHSVVSIIEAADAAFWRATLDTFVGSITPDADFTYNLGTASKRWQNVYTGDLHLRNERGDYTLIEEEDCLTIRFNKNGKRYKFLRERAPEYDE